MMLPAILFVTLSAAQSPAVQSRDLPAATPAVAQASIDAGLALFRKRHFTQAEAEFQKAVDADPAGAAGYFYLGYSVYKIAEPKRPFHPEKRRAAELFAKAYELDPGFRPVWAGRR
jgi:Tfp pilus assembly protein PilF